MDTLFKSKHFFDFIFILLNKKTFSMLYYVKGSDKYEDWKIKWQSDTLYINTRRSAERQLQLSELAYGTEKARSLFHDMMQQAAQEFGFEAENMPLMIEAIPSSSDSIVLIILKSRSRGTRHAFF